MAAFEKKNYITMYKIKPTSNLSKTNMMCDSISAAICRFTVQCAIE